MRNDMYLVSDAIRLLSEMGVTFDQGQTASLKAYREALNEGTR